MAKAVSHHLKMTSFLRSFYFSTWRTKNSDILIYFRMGPYFRWPEYHVQSRDAMNLRVHRRRDCFAPTRPGDPCLCRPTPIDVFIILHLWLDLTIRRPLREVSARLRRDSTILRQNQSDSAGHLRAVTVTRRATSPDSAAAMPG